MSRHNVRNLSRSECKLIIDALMLAGIQGRSLVQLELKRSHGPNQPMMFDQIVTVKRLHKLAKRLERARSIGVQS
jgi:hypothetical protein